MKTTEAVLPVTPSTTSDVVQFLAASYGAASKSGVFSGEDLPLFSFVCSRFRDAVRALPAGVFVVMGMVRQIEEPVPENLQVQFHFTAYPPLGWMPPFSSVAEAKGQFRQTRYFGSRDNNSRVTNEIVTSIIINNLNGANGAFSHPSVLLREVDQIDAITASLGDDDCDAVVGFLAAVEDAAIQAQRAGVLCGGVAVFDSRTGPTFKTFFSIDPTSYQVDCLEYRSKARCFRVDVRCHDTAA